MAESVKRLTSSQVVISWFVGSSPASGSVLTAQSLEPASDSVSPSLFPSPALSRSLSKINIKKNLFNIYLFLRDRERAGGGEGQREGDTESKAGSRI